MPAGIRLPRNLFRRVRQQTAQFRATTGRDIHPALLEKLLEAETSAILNQQLGVAEFESREKFRAGQLELAEEEIEAKGQASAVSGLAQLGTTAFIGRELLKKGAPAVAGGTVTAPTVGAGAQQVTAEIATGAVGTAPAVTPAVAGAEVGVGGAATTAGATGTTATAGTGAATTAAAGGAAPGLLTSAAGLLGPIGVGAGAGQLIFGGERGLIGKGEATQTAGAAGGGALAGAYVGAQAGSVGGPVGAVIGAAAGLIINEASKSSVICKELNRQGYIPDEILKLDGEFRKEYISDNVYAGYLSWANTVVKWMKKYPTVTTIVKPIGVAWAYEMAHRKDPHICDGNILGKILLKVGVPICWVINKIREIYISNLYVTVGGKNGEIS